MEPLTDTTHGHPIGMHESNQIYAAWAAFEPLEFPGYQEAADFAAAQEDYATPSGTSLRLALAAKAHEHWSQPGTAPGGITYSFAYAYGRPIEDVAEDVIGTHEVEADSGNWLWETVCPFEEIPLDWQSLVLATLRKKCRRTGRRRPDEVEKMDAGACVRFIRRVREKTGASHAGR